MANEKFPGVVINIGGIQRIVPSLTLRQFRAAYPVLTATIDPSADAKAQEAREDAILDVILVALKNNYPDMTLDILRDGLTVASFLTALKAVQGASGMTTVEPGEATPA